MSKTPEAAVGWGTKLWAVIGGGAVALLGAAIFAGGAWLAALHGSPYYVLAGAALVATGVLLACRRPIAGFVYAATMAATLVWGIWEAGLAFWPLLPRIFAPAVLGLLVLLVMPAARKSGGLRRRAVLAILVTALPSIALLGATIPATYKWGQAKTPAALDASAPAAAPTSDWRYYGRDPGGSRYASLDQINLQNVDKLKVAWTFRTGEKSNRESDDQNTPMQVGDTLYICTPTSIVIAVNADTGKEKWRHDPKATPLYWNRCRGVGYWDGSQPKVAFSAIVPAAASPVASVTASADPLCRRRVISTTINGELFALDAETGKLCPGFGQNGKVSLAEGMGPLEAGFYFQTSTPTVVGDRIIVGGFVMDNQKLAEPSGVVRAFSAVTGELLWAWDLGNPQIDKLPDPGKTYSRGTPNVWSTPAFDPDLGLIYLPTGNATPDYWASHRSTASEKYSSSVVALDIATGKERWKFQTVHHDVWDYDVASQPMLIDFPTANGSVPALVQMTKNGQIFVLDRRTGKPLTRVVEKPVPQGAAPGEWMSPTQPYSVDMPQIRASRLTEKVMWGVTPLDQLYCRLKFRSLRYDGDFTPPGTKVRSIQYPANIGGMNWGSAAFDPRRGLLIVSDVRLPQVVQLAPSTLPELSLSLADKDRPPQSQKAISYKSSSNWMLTPATVPCIQPPHGVLTAVDVRTRKIVWEVPAGTAEAQAPFGLRSHLPIPIGTMGMGGPITTAGGVTFRGATSDPYLRGYDSATGKMVWQARLPESSGSTPMTYVSPRTGKQYVVLTASGARGIRQDTPRGDYVVAFALP